MNKKKKKYLIDKIILIFVILVLLIQIGNFVIFNPIDTFYFSYLFENWSNQINPDIFCLNCKKDNNNKLYSYLNNDTKKCINNSFNLFEGNFIENKTEEVSNFFELNSPEEKKKMAFNTTFNTTKVNGSIICSKLIGGNNNYLSIFRSLSNENSNITIDSLNNSFKFSESNISEDLNKYMYNNSNGKHYYFSSYIFSINEPYLDPKCNKFNLTNNTCTNNAVDPNSFKILTMNLSLLIKDNNNTDYNGNETITLYGKMYYGLNKSNINCSFSNKFEIIKGENDLLIRNIINAKKWLISGLINQIILILLYLEKFIVSYIKNHNGKETLPNYVKPLLMIVSIIEFITCAMLFSLITFHPNIMDDLYEKENCLDISIHQFIKPLIKYYKICEYLNIIALILSFLNGIYLGIRRAIKYAN